MWNRRGFITAAAAAPLAAAGSESGAKRVLLTDSYTVVWESPDAATSYAYSPGIARLPNGRLVATSDSNMPKGAGALHGHIFTSDDRGRTWKERAQTPMVHARPFAAGKSVYVLGHSGDLTIVRSDDNGGTWSPAVKLTEKQRWHQAPCNVHYCRDRVYLVMERNMDPAFKGWAVSVLAPVVLSAKVTDDLTKRENWVFSNELSFRDAVAKAGAPHMLGAPFFTPGATAPGMKDRRNMAPIGWLETNIVQFTDPDHVWFDPAGRTFHLWARAHTGGTNLACIAKAVESEDARSITVSLENAPSGEPMLYVPCPGGQMKFHILFDAKTKLFWLLSSQATDSMTRPDRLPPNRYNLPNNERHRLALHFSRNCVDWCFAGLVADTGNPAQSRNYASMVIDGDDLHVLSRSGDKRAKNAHDGNIITFHTVKRFRDLVY